MFASDEVTVEAGFEAARARLVNLTHGGWLAAASSDAYADGLGGLIRVGPFGDVLGASKLVRVELLEPVPRQNVVVLPLRWQAAGAMGRLFPVLDADLTLRPAGARQTLMRLDGPYRPPRSGLLPGTSLGWPPTRSPRLDQARCARRQAGRALPPLRAGSRRNIGCDPDSFLFRIWPRPVCAPGGAAAFPDPAQAGPAGMAGPDKRPVTRPARRPAAG